MSRKFSAFFCAAWRVVCDKAFTGYRLLSPSHGDKAAWIIFFKKFMITYKTGNDLDLDAVIELYRVSTLGERRPVDERERMRLMLQNANLVITAWDGDLLVGISRSLTDFAYATYLSDLAVRLSHQRSGIGKELMRRTQAAAPQAMVILLAAPAAEKYYPHVGFTPHPQAWILRAGQQIQP